MNNYMVNLWQLYVIILNTNYHKLTTNYSRIIFIHFTTTFFPLKIYTPL